MTWCDERNAFADQGGDDVNDELIDRAFVEERSDDAGAAHHPDIFSRQRTQTLGEFRNRFLNKLGSGDRLPRRLAREDVVLNLRVEPSELAAHLSGQGGGFSSPQDGVDRAIELAHAIVALYLRTIQPINGTIAPRDVTVGAGGDVNDDLSHV